MHKHRKLLATAIAAAAILGAAAAVHAGVKLVDRGPSEGGEFRQYTAFCPTGQQTFVHHYWSENRVCYNPVGDPEHPVCVPGNDIDRAAERACRE